MPSFSNLLITNEAEVDARLSDFNLTRSQIAAIGKTARAYADDASPSMPLNAPGMLSYIHGVGELRQQLVGQFFTPDRTCGIESVIDVERSIRIGFQNVDKCCVEMPPIPRTDKGNGAAALSSTNLWEHFGVEAGPLTGVKDDGVRTYYVMVGQDGSVELSCPVIERGKYIDWPERIFISSPEQELEVVPESNDAPTDDFEISVSFKET